MFLVLSLGADGVVAGGAGVDVDAACAVAFVVVVVVDAVAVAVVDHAAIGVVVLRIMLLRVVMRCC